MMTVQHKLFMKNTMTFYKADSFLLNMQWTFDYAMSQWLEKKPDCNPPIFLKESMQARKFISGIKY